MKYQRLGAVAVGLVLSGLGGGLAAGQQQPPAAPVPQPARPVQIIQNRVPAVVPPQVVGNVMGQLPQSEGSPEATAGVKLLVDPRTRRKMDEAHRLVEAKEWSQAIRLLQGLIDSKEDVFIQDRSENTKARQVSVRAEANRLLGSLPREGRQFYEQEFGAEARRLLRQGMAESDPQVFGEVTGRFFHTEAGAEAAALLGSYHLDHGRYIVAALCFERLLDREGTGEQLTPLQLYKAAVAFERAGDARNRDRAFGLMQHKVEQPGARPLPPALRALAPQQLRDALALKNGLPTAAGRDDWPVFMGAPDRTALGVGGAPFLVPRQGYPFDATVNLYQPKPLERVRSWLEQAVRQQRNNLSQPILSGYHPLAVGGKLVYRSYWGLHAVNAKTGGLLWETPSKYGLYDMANRGNDPTGLAEQSLGMYVTAAPSVLFDNTLLGTLSTDGTLVYAVEDLALPPIQNYMELRGGRFIGNMGTNVYERLKYNKLVAYELASGLTAWEVGGGDDDQPFSDLCFLGPPLPLGDKLYAMAEHSSNGELRLLCLQSRRTAGDQGQPRFAAQLVWSQTLCLMDRRLVDEPIRRTQATPLAYGEGILVCPTNAGAVLGVDLLTRTLLWAHFYREERSTQAGEMNLNAAQQRALIRGRAIARFDPANWTRPLWSVSAPAIQGGLAVCAAPDGDKVFALNLRDGTLAWSVDRVKEGAGGTDLYLAGVFGGKVVIVSQRGCRALDLRDGTKELWNTPVNPPAGRGVAAGNHYYLPVRGADNKTGEVWTINLETGKVEARSKSYGQEVPGNLVFHDGDVFSQSYNRVIVYPQLAVREQEITARLAKDASDPVGLTERGELRLYRGEYAGAVADLRAALAAPLEPAGQAKVRDKLFEALCELLDRNFAGHEGDLPQLAELAAVPVPEGTPAVDREKMEKERADRRARYLRILAQGREAQGRLADALRAYLEFTTLGDQRVTSPEDTAVLILPEVWAQGRVAALRAKATPDQQKALDAAFTEQWEEVRKDGSIDALRRYADFFGPLCDQGREAMLLLADKLIEGRQNPNEAFRWLHALSVDRHATALQSARALDGLARANTRVGELADAAEYYRQLARNYPKLVVRDGKTGEELFLELATDKRFLPYLEDVRPGLLGYFGPVKVDGTTAFVNTPASRNLMWAEPAEGMDVPPFFRRYRLGLEVNQTGTERAARLIDTHSGQERHRFPLGGMNVLALYGRQNRPRVEYRLAGQTMVFAWGEYLYLYEPLAALYGQGKEQQAVRSINLLGTTERPSSPYSQGGVQNNLLPQGNGRFRLSNSQNFIEAVGTVGVVTPRAVAFSVRDRGLVVLDPVTGRERWVRADVSAGQDLFGDGDFVCAATGKGDEFYGSATGPVQPATVVRLADGAQVEAPDFTELYQRRVGQHGRCLLVRDVDRNREGGTLRLYDVSAGRDVWAEPVSVRALPVAALVPEVTGALEPDGTLRVLRVADGRPLLTAKLPPGEAATPGTLVHLLADDHQWYVFLARPAQQRMGQAAIGTVNYNLSHALRGVPVNGPAYAFDRGTGAQRWRTELPAHLLIVEQFADLPLVLCASSQQETVRVEGARGRAFKFVNKVQVFDKASGATVFEDTSDSQSGSLSQFPFHSLQVDALTGRIELATAKYRVTLNVTRDGTSSQ